MSQSTARDSNMEVPQADGPPKVLVLPEGASPEARICTLAHPRTLTPSRYYFDPSKGLYEFTSVAAPTFECRSWLISRQKVLVNHKDDTAPTKARTAKDKSEPRAAKADDRPISEGYTIGKAEMMIATPIDYLFLLLPSFTYEPPSKSPTSKRLFLSAADLLERLSEISRHFNHISSHEQTRSAMEQRLRAVCDTVEARDEEMYRLSDEKLLRELVLKAKTMVAKGLPASVEERFIRKALETPVMVVKHEESSGPDATMSQNEVATSESIVSETADSQASTASAESTASALSTDSEMTVPEDNTPAINVGSLYHLLRLRTALSYLISSYVPLAIAKPLSTLIASGKSQVNFKILDEHLAEIARIRAEALASRSLGDFSRKRGTFEDDGAETRAEKKRRKEEEEKKKKSSESRGIKDLKKVDIKGMKKMSDFFGKAPAAKKE